MSNRGFTLVEVLVALALLTVGLLAAARVLTASAATNGTARMTTQATTLAMEKMEQLRALSIDDPALQPSAPEALAGTFVRSWSVTPLPSYPDHGVAIRVVVTATGGAAAAVLDTIKVRKPSAAATE